MKAKKTGKRLLSLLLALIMVLGASSVFATAEQKDQVFVTEPMVSSGGHHTLALKSDGTVWAWGANNYGQLGNGTTNNSNEPVQVTGLSKVISVSAGGSHTLALKSDGTVWAWGSNSYGQLGNGTSEYESFSSVPVQVVGLTDVIAISAGSEMTIATGSGHSMALKSDGTVWSWGENFDGELGTGASGEVVRFSAVPVQVTGLTDVIEVSAGAYYSLAVKSNGTVWAWGNNVYGMLGNGTTYNSSVPVQVTALTDVVGISAGHIHSLAVKSNGTVWAWGYNYCGELGNATTVDSYVPVQVTELTNVVGISAGLAHSMAVKSDGTLWAWGGNYSGELGNATTDDSYVPVQISSLTDVKMVSGGEWISAAVKGNGTVWIWGDITAYDKTPTQMIGENGNGFLNLDAKSINYYDVPGNVWYYNAVQYAAQNDLMVGTSDTAFEPGTNMARAMVAVVLYKMEGTPEVSGTANFTDVTVGGWYADAVNWAYENNVISGYGNGKFGPGDNISREQFATMMRNYAEYKNMDISDAADLSKYTDTGEISSWATAAMNWAVDSKLMSGTSETTLDPQGTATRAQCAALLMNWMVNIAA